MGKGWYGWSEGTGGAVGTNRPKSTWFDVNRLCSLSLDSGCGHEIYWDLWQSIQNYGHMQEHRISLQLDTGRDRETKTKKCPIFANWINWDLTRKYFASLRAGSMEFSLGANPRSSFIFPAETWEQYL